MSPRSLLVGPSACLTLSTTHPAPSPLPATPIPPPQDVTETEGAFVISVDVPGVEPSAIKVNLSDGVLTIRGERKTAAGHKAFQRAFALPRNVDADAVEAHLANGVLEVTLPKVGAGCRGEEPAWIVDSVQPLALGAPDMSPGMPAVLGLRATTRC